MEVRRDLRALLGTSPGHPLGPETPDHRLPERGRDQQQGDCDDKRGECDPAGQLEHPGQPEDDQGRSDEHPNCEPDLGNPARLLAESGGEDAGLGLGQAVGRCRAPAQGSRDQHDQDAAPEHGKRLPCAEVERSVRMQEQERAEGQDGGPGPQRAQVWPSHLPHTVLWDAASSVWWS